MLQGWCRVKWKTTPPLEICPCVGGDVCVWVCIEGCVCMQQRGSVNRGCAETKIPTHVREVGRYVLLHDLLGGQVGGVLTGLWWGRRVGCASDPHSLQLCASQTSHRLVHVCVQMLLCALVALLLHSRLSMSHLLACMIKGNVCCRNRQAYLPMVRQIVLVAVLRQLLAIMRRENVCYRGLSLEHAGDDARLVSNGCSAAGA